MSDSPTAETMAMQELAQLLGNVLHGQPPSVIGGALADLVAMYLAGYFPPAVREGLLQLHIETVRQLIPPNERVLLERARRGDENLIARVIDLKRAPDAPT